MAVIWLAACGGASSQPTATAPTITSQPASVTVPVGQSASFTVQASGTPPLTYQWYRGGVAIAGSTTATVTLTAVQASDSGAVFYAVVRNAVGTATSNMATLTITPNTALGGVHGLTVLFPPTSSGQLYYRDVQTYLVNGTSAPVSGANFSVAWSTVDKGPGSSPRYDWTAVDNEIQPWINAGKKAYLTVWGVGYGSGTGTLGPTPAYVQSQVTILNCTGSAPAYWQQAYVQNYQAFMTALIGHYGNNASIGYIRFGLGIGGESTVVNGFNSADCQAQLTAAGYSKQVWLAYLDAMLDFEKSLHAPVQLMVGLNVPNSIVPDYTIPDSVAARAVTDGIGIGSQGLQQSDIASYSASTPCAVDWCNLFVKYAGRVPLELQTLAASDPSGGGMVGSLVTLFPFALQLHARNFEIYYQDWLTGYDPSYPGYAQYHAAYQQAFQATAAALAP